MMVQSTPFTVIVAALLIITLSYCSAENVYCVTPTANSCSFCPHNSSHCTTLSEYAQEAELYFTSNTTMLFLPGDHVLDRNVTVANVTSLTMCGDSSSDNRAIIVCDGSVGLSFTNMVELKIDSLAFTSCSRRYVIILPDFPLAIANVTLHLQYTQDAELINCSFHDNIATALVVNDTNITLAGNTEFMHNRVLCSRMSLGGSIIALRSNLILTGNTTFFGNSAPIGQCSFNIFHLAGGGAIFTLNNTVLSFIGTTNFISNAAGDGGAISAQNTVLSFNGTSNFINNSASAGGAIYTSGHTTLNFNGTSHFINNSAYIGVGGAICVSDNTVLSFSGTSHFINNSACSGGAIFTINTVLSLNGTSQFINNSATMGGAISTDINNTLTFNGTIYFINNGHYEETVCSITGAVYIVNGHTVGGGIYMGIKSTFSILPNTTVYWENNHATLGGAIYVQDASPASYCTSHGPYGPKEECFFQLPGQNLSNGIDVNLIFKNNSADVAGSELYGGAIDNCKLTHGLDSRNSGKVFDMIAHNNDTDYNTTSTISSYSLNICPCENNHPDCSKSEYNVPHTVYPGETFQVSVVAVGQRDGTVPSAVKSSVDNIASPRTNLQGSQHLQQAGNTCTKLNYTVFSLICIVDIELSADGSPCSVENTLEIFVTLNQTCPPGFSISESEKSCICEPRLAQYTNSCTIINGVGQVTRESHQHFWVGYDNQSHELILHPQCPFDYCVSHDVVFPPNNGNLQCAHHRSGLLCGACKGNFSLVLGTSHCKQCTNSHLTLLIPFAVMGVALVFLLLVCKLTVATGTLSGLVFYANIVGVNRIIFLPVETTDAFSVFIAWLNLDFGIETCFYNGMDGYSKTWLQFVFPVYIWVLVGLMIFVSHFSCRFAKLLGNNPVSVLATLLLLSYTKILRTLIAAIHITYLQYPDYNRGVWLYDANIDYLVGKHTALFIAAVLVFLFLFLPYTLLLLFGQCLQVVSHLRPFSWVNSARLKPFMDAYSAPYKAKHRYWPGLLLVLRFLLLLVFSLNPQQDPSVNLLAILVVTGILQMWAWVSGGVYRNWCLDALEGSFALNLIILAASTLYIMYVSHSEAPQLVKGNQLAVGCNSVSVALLTFIGILTYHIFQQLRHTKLWKVSKLNFNRQTIVEAMNEPAENLAAETDFSQLREPLLEDPSQPNYGAF